MTRSAIEMDRHVGSRIRLRRLLMKMSQQKLAGELGIAFQQLQKYEKGTNRVSASRLQQIAGLLGVQVDFFFAGTPASGEPADDLPLNAYADLLTAEAMSLLRAFTAIKNANVRKRLIGLVRALGPIGRDDDRRAIEAVQVET